MGSAETFEEACRRIASSPEFERRYEDAMFAAVGPALSGGSVEVDLGPVTMHMSWE